MGIVCIVCGVVAITVGIFGKEFYAADIDSGGAYKQKRSRRFGRIFSITVGVLFIGVGIKLLLGTD